MLDGLLNVLNGLTDVEFVEGPHLRLYGITFFFN